MHDVCDDRLVFPCRRNRASAYLHGDGDAGGKAANGSTSMEQLAADADARINEVFRRSEVVKKNVGHFN